VLLLDEPFGALDTKVRKELRRWLRRLHDEMHISSVFVTHDQEEALEVADRVVVMNHGKIEQIGSPDEVYSNPASSPFRLSVPRQRERLPQPVCISPHSPYCGRNTAKRFKFQARQTSVHSPVTFFKPRREKRRKPITDLMIPKTGSIVCLRKA
jgi:ABC-type sulfate/molybdate transport systems ATPase subunit